MRIGRRNVIAALACGALVAACTVAQEKPATVVIPPSPPLPPATVAPAETAVEAATTAAPVDPDAASAAVDRALASQVRRIGPDVVEMPAPVLDEAVEHSADVTRPVEVSLVRAKGAVVGLRLAGIRDGSFLAAIGLRDDDVLERINGSSLTTPEAALEAYAHLRGARQVELGLKRDGKSQLLRILVR